MIASRGFQQTSVVLLLIILVEQKCVDPTIVQGPSDTTAMVTESTYFNCSTSIRPVDQQSIIWFHFPLDGGGQRNYVYDDGRIMTNYKNRFDIEIDLSSGKFNLVAKRLESRDAGRYECRDDVLADVGVSAELTILESNLHCESDLSSVGVVEPTQCDRAPDEQLLSCSLSYNGKNAPRMTWRKFENPSTSTKADCVTKGNRVICNVTLTANLQLTRTVFICELTTHKYNCSLEIKNAPYVFSGNTIVNMKIGEDVRCSANSSQPCSYKWKWFSLTDSLTVSTDQTLKPTRVGSHRCEATCPIGNKTCKVDVMFAEVYSTQSSAATTGQYLWLLLPLLILIMAIIVFLFLIFKRPSCLQRKQPLQRFKTLILYANEESFIDLLDLSGLPNTLHSEKVIKQSQLDFISSEQTEQNRIKALLGILRRCSVRDYQQTIICLRQSNQSHIADVFEKGGVVARAHVHLDGPSETVTEKEDEFVERFSSELSSFSIEKRRRILERFELDIIGAKKGQSIVLYIWCKKMQELLHLHDLLTSVSLKDSVEQLFNQFLTSPKTAKVKDITMSDKEFRRWKKYLTDMDKLSSVGKTKVEPIQMGVIETVPSVVKTEVEPSQMGDYASQPEQQPEATTIQRVPSEISIESTEPEDGFRKAVKMDPGLCGKIRGPLKYKGIQCACEKIYMYIDESTQANEVEITKQKNILSRSQQWKSLDHKNLIRFYDVVLQRSDIFIIMEYTAGGSVRNMIQRCMTDLPVTVVIDWATQIAMGMEYLHDQDIVHKVLNSIRILIMESFEATDILNKTLKISQFCLIDDETTSTNFDEKLPYLAPENGNGTYGKEGDVWSFGIVIREILTRGIPFEGWKDPSIVVDEIRKGVKDLKIPDWCPRELKDILEGCRNQYPSKRPSFREIVQRLKAW